MKKVWGKLKKAWWGFWGIYEDDDDSVQRLSRSDKLSVWYGSFIMCMAAITICTLATAVSSIRVSRQNAQDMEDVVGMIATYFATATEDEYDKIASTIQHDLIFSEYSTDIGNLMQYIPNTAKNCPACREDYPAQAFLICVNTGEQYSLDLSEKGDETEVESGGMRLSFGYDEISETSIHVTKNGKKSGDARIYRGRRIVSAQKMKSVFCDDCIRKILDTIDGQLLDEVVFFDAQKRAFYPVEDESTLLIGDYELESTYDGGDYKVDIRLTGE